MIGKGLQALAELKQQWTQLMLYFQQIENLVHATLGPTLENFVKISNASKDCISFEEGERLSIQLRDRLYKRALMASRTAAVVKFLALSYETVGSDHLIPLANDFQKLLAYDSERDVGRIKMEKQKIEHKAIKAQEAIQGIVEEGHDKFKSDISKRQQEIDLVLENYNDRLPQLPQLPKEEKEKIQRIAKKTYEQAEKKKMEPNNYDDFLE